MNLTKEQVHQLIKDYRDRLFEKYDKPIPYGQYDGKLDPETEAGLEHHRQKYLHQRIAGDYSEIEQVADKLLVDAGIQVEKTTLEYTHLCHGLLKAESEGVERYQNNLDGKPT